MKISDFTIHQSLCMNKLENLMCDSQWGLVKAISGEERERERDGEGRESTLAIGRSTKGLWANLLYLRAQKAFFHFDAYYLVLVKRCVYYGCEPLRFIDVKSEMLV